ncbi:hypothetical protein GCM10028805_61340 [Spirosoma harenae]
MDNRVIIFVFINKDAKMPPKNGVYKIKANSQYKSMYVIRDTEISNSIYFGRFLKKSSAIIGKLR